MKPNVILFIVDQLSAKWLEVARDAKICALPKEGWRTGAFATLRAIRS
jgi:hypothetical protein